MGWSGYNGQKYHTKHKPRKAFKNVKHYQKSSSNHDARLAPRDSNEEITFSNLIQSITLQKLVWPIVLTTTSLLIVLFLTPHVLNFIVKEGSTINLEREAIKNKKNQAYSVLMKGGTRAFNQHMYDYTISEIERAHAIYPYKITPRYVLAVSYSETCISNGKHCNSAKYFTNLFQERVKTNSDWDIQKQYVEN